MSAATEADFIRVCHVDELPKVGAAKAEIEGRVVSIVRAEDGSVHCIDDECTHGRVSLSEGEVEGCEIECWLHGSRFNLVSGQPTCLPATVPVVVHSVQVTGGEVFVRLSDEAPRTV